MSGYTAAYCLSAPSGSPKQPGPRAGRPAAPSRPGTAVTGRLSSLRASAPSDRCTQARQCACAIASPLLQGRRGVGQSGPRRPHEEGLPVPVRPLPAAAMGLSPGGLPAPRSVLCLVAGRQLGLLPRNGAVTFNCTADVPLREPPGTAPGTGGEQRSAGPRTAALRPASSCEIRRVPVTSQPAQGRCQVSPRRHAASIQTHPEQSPELNQPVTKLS